VVLTRKRMKTIRMVVKSPGGDVRISAPFEAPESAIVRFVTAHSDWIAKQRARVARVADTAPAGPQFVTGERHRYLGREYTLLVSERPGRPVVELCAETIHMQIAPAAAATERRAALEHWYFERLRELIGPLFERWEAVLGVQASHITIRPMKTRWGSCSPTTRRISLNLELAKYPPQNLEHTIVHELVHILQPNHGPQFYALMDRAMPEWRAIRKSMGNRE
jgi:predicted metal-dependent hydrolase